MAGKKVKTKSEELPEEIISESQKLTEEIISENIISFDPPPKKEVSGLESLTGTYLLKPTKTTWLANMDPKHDGAVMFTGTFTMICPERDKNTGLVKTGLTEQQARELETKMMLKPNSLSPYNKEFWADFKIYPRVSKDGIMLDGSRSDLDKVQIAFLRANSKVATSRIEAMENPLKEFILTDENAEAKHENKKYSLKREAYKKLEKLTLEDSINFLLVFKQGKYKVSTGSTPDLINSTMAKVVEENPKDFLDLIDNPQYNDFIFLRKCITNGLIRNKGGIYETLTGDVIGDSFEKAVYNLAQPDYNGVKIALLTKLDAK